MAKFQVKTQIKMNGKTYEPGDSIDLSKRDAEAMPWAIAAPEEEKAAPKPPAPPKPPEQGEKQKEGGQEKAGEKK